VGFKRLLKYGLVTWKDFVTIAVKFSHLRMKNLGTELAMTYLILAIQEAIGRSEDGPVQSSMKMDREQSNRDDYVGKPLVNASILDSTGLGTLDAIQYFVEQ
jgi:hypothetical protein